MDRKKRLFERRPPSRDAKSIYIFCEGRRREYDYFRFFAEIDSRVNLVVHKLNPNDDNSPKGLIRIAGEVLPSSFQEGGAGNGSEHGDEVWFVIDTDPDKFDSRKAQILEARQICLSQPNWFVAESNPCFEVWLFMHCERDGSRFEGDHACKNWKTLVNEAMVGGFDSRKHPLLIGKAIIRAEAAPLQANGDGPQIGETEVYRLASRIQNMLRHKLEFQ